MPSFQPLPNLTEVLGREPTPTETKVFEIQNSERCSYRSSKVHLRTLPVDAPNVLVGVGEDAGIVDFAVDNDDYNYEIAIGHSPMVMGSRTVAKIDVGENSTYIGELREDEIIHSFVPETADGWEIIIVKNTVDGAQDITYDLFEKLRDEDILGLVSLKDMGAGGDICTILEQVEREGFGAEISLPKERLFDENESHIYWICDPSLTQKILDHYKSAGMSADAVGAVKKRNYIVRDGEEILVDAPVSALTENPSCHRSYSPKKRDFSEPETEPTDLSAVLIQMLGDKNLNSNIATKNIFAPFGDYEDVPEIQKVGAIFSIDSSPRYSKISPYWGAVNSIVKGMRNVAAVGATPWAVTDALNFGNPEKEEEMWELVESIRGIKEALEGIGHFAFDGAPVPVIAGSVSLYNEFSNSAAPSPIIGTLGRMLNLDKAITPELKQVSSRLYLIGERVDELGDVNIPQPDFKTVANELKLILKLIDQEIILSCKAVSDGGVAVALAKMLAKSTGEFGISVDIRNMGILSAYRRLFSETGGFVLEFSSENESGFLATCAGFGISPICLGDTVKEPSFAVFDNAQLLFALPIEKFRNL